MMYFLGAESISCPGHVDYLIIKTSSFKWKGSIGLFYQGRVTPIAVPLVQ